MEEENIINQIKTLSKQVSFNQGKYELNAKDGNFILEDRDKNLHTLIPVEVLNNLLSALHEAKEENFKLKLEKVIWKHVPVDFADTWEVVMSEIENATDKNLSDINLNSLVKGVKKKHPNLFVNIEDFLPIRQMLS